MISTTYNNNINNSDSSAIDYILTQRLLQLNTTLPCKILAVNNKTCDVISMINYLDANNLPTTPPIQYNVPIMDIVGNNCGFEVEYAKDDIVLVNYCQRDLTNLETIWNTGADPINQINPNSYRMFNLSDGIIIGRISPKKPDIKIKVTSNGIEIIGKNKPIKIDTTENLTINCKNANITATGDVVAKCINAEITATGNTKITSPTINLVGNVIINGSMQCTSAIISGALSCTDASIGGKLFATHVHSGVQTGSNNTGTVV